MHSPDVRTLRITHVGTPDMSTTKRDSARVGCGRLVRRDYCRAHCPRKGWNDAKRAECRRETMCAPLAAAINGQAFREIRRFNDAND